MGQTNTVRPNTIQIAAKPWQLLNRIIVWIASKFGTRAKEVERFMKFVMVGTVGAIVDFSTLFILQATVLSPSEPYIGIKVFLATSLAFLAAVTSNFIWNRFWTYPDSRSRSVRRQMAQFTFVNAIGWGMRTLWISLMYTTIGRLATPHFVALITRFSTDYVPTPETSIKVGTLMAQFIAIFFVMIWNFFANRYWTYNDVN